MAEPRRSESTEESKDDDTGKINGLQIAAASGAASTGAVAAHALGIYGTVGGVALFSVVSSVGTVLYLKSMHRTRDKLRKVVKQVNTTAKTEKTTPNPEVDPTQVITRQERGDPDPTIVITRQERDDPDATVVIARQESGTTRALSSDGESGDSDEQPENFPTQLRALWKRYWKPVAVTSAAAFVLSLAILTSLAWVSGQPPTQYYNGNPSDSAPAPKPTQPADEDTFDEDAPPSQPEESEETDPSPQPSQPQETSPEGDGDTDEQSQEPSTPPDDPGTTNEEPQESPQDEGDDTEQ